MNKQDLLDSAKSLPASDRIDLVMDLWETVGDDDLPLSEEQRAVLDRRMAADEANPQPAKEWVTLKAELLRGDF